MDLPPSNSFCRMLTHKLADYYHMTHSFEAVAGAVRIYRTPFCRVPPPLSSIVVNPSSNNSPSQAVLPRKIMRRDRDGDPGTLSGDPSKPTSEAGSDSKDKSAPTKEKYVIIPRLPLLTPPSPPTPSSSPGPPPPLVVSFAPLTDPTPDLPGRSAKKHTTGRENESLAVRTRRRHPPRVCIVNPTPTPTPILRDVW